MYFMFCRKHFLYLGELSFKYKYFSLLKCYETSKPKCFNMRARESKLIRTLKDEGVPIPLFTGRSHTIFCLQRE